MRAAHRPFRALAAEFLFGKSRHDDRQLMRRQRICVMQHCRYGQIFASHRTVDDDLQAFYGGENIDGAPIAAGSVVIEDEHQPTSFKGAATRVRGLASGRGCGGVPQTPAASPIADASEKRFHLVEAGTTADCGVDDLGERACASDAHERTR